MASELTRNRSGECFLDSPAATIYPHLDGLPVHANFFRPIANVLGSAIECKHSCPGTIFDLLRIGGPSAICWRVMSVVINPVKLVLGRRCAAHVCKKIRERMPPFKAYRDAAPAISGVSVHAGINTTPNHGIPSPPFFGALTASCFPVLEVFGFHLLMLAWGIRYVKR